MKKSILIIGMGRFGKHLSSKLVELGNDVVVIDSNEDAVSDLTDVFTDVVIADATNQNVLSSLGINNFDECFVCIGENFEASLIITSMLKDMGAKYILSKAKSDRQAALLKKIGATDVCYPEKEIAQRLAVEHNFDKIFDFVELNSEYAVFEIPVLRKWENKTVAEADIRRKYGINIVAIKNNNNINVNFSSDYVLKSDEHLMVIGREKEVFNLAKKND